MFSFSVCDARASAISKPLKDNRKAPFEVAKVGRASNAFNKKVFFSPAFIHTTLALPASATPFNFRMLAKKASYWMRE